MVDSVTSPEPPGEPPSGRQGPTLSFKQAAEASSVSLSTLKRHRPELVALGARRNARGVWEVPYAALITLGLVPRTTPSEPPDGPSPEPPLDPRVVSLSERVRELEHQLEVERAVSRERERVIDAQQLALRAIESAGRPDPTPDQDTPAPQQEEDRPRHRWWRRRAGGS